MIYYVFLTLLLIIMLVMIIVILLQRARGGGLVGALGAGGSETALGALGNKEMVKFTTWLAIAFFLLLILLDFNPPERNSTDLGGIVNSGETVSVPRFDEEGEILSSEEAPVEVEGGAAVDEDLLGGALGSGDGPIEADPGAGSE